MRGKIFSYALIGLAMTMLAPASNLRGAASLRDRAMDIEWTSQNIQALQRLIPNHNVATTFVRELYTDPLIKPNVGDYAFADFGIASGGVAFVATLDWSGRAFYTNILVIHKAGRTFLKQEIKADGVTNQKYDPTRSIRDLYGNGEKEILVPRLIEPYAGARPAPVITDVYEWNGSRFEKADGAFRSYYLNTVLPGLRTKLASLRQGKSNVRSMDRAFLQGVLEKEIAEVNTIVYGR